MPHFSVKIKTSVIVVLSFVILLIVGIMISFQYKSSSEFALLATQEKFYRISHDVINQIHKYDSNSIGFVKMVQKINHSDDLPDINKRHVLLPIITQYIKTANYVYGIYIGFQNNNFYIVYNLSLSDKMKKAQNAPNNAKWLIKKNIKENGKLVSYKEFIDENFITISTIKESTTYQPTQRPWYKDAINSKDIIKTKPYVFSSVQTPGVTYAQSISNKNGTVLSLDITLSSLSKLLASQKLVKGSASFIFKKDGKIIGQADNISNKEVDNLNKQYPDIFIKDNNILDLEKQTIIKINGKEYFKYTTMLKSDFDSKDYLTILSPMDVIMKPYNDKIYKTLFITLATLLLFVIPIIFYFLQLIVRPILRLNEENKKIEDGKFEDICFVDSMMVEITYLSKSLVAMASSIEESKKDLETKVELRTAELALEKENVEQILTNILFPVLITSKAKRTIVYANKFAQDLYEVSEDAMIDAQLDDIYTLTNGPAAIIKELTEVGKVNGLEECITTHTGKKFTGLLSVIPILYNNEECYIGMTIDITEQKDMENKFRQMHQHTRDAIEYASLIQSAVLPDNKLLSNYFKDHFVTWHPKDTVGGDIWLFDQLRNKDECLLFFIDCTGHGVPGAFVTMIVKAIEREIIAKILEDKEMEVSPAWVMGYFNRTMKTLLKQETKDSLSNAGWDGGIIYYNKREKILKFAGAETPLFYVDVEGNFNTIKGNRYSVGYKKCAMDYEYKETILEVEEGMKFYCTTDGYLDQNGGEKDFPFGKKRFGNIIKEYHKENMAEQQTVFMLEMDEYEHMIPNNDRNDDMTLIGFEI